MKKTARLANRVHKWMNRESFLKALMVSVVCVAILGINGMESVQGAAAFPTKPITLIVPWAPGGSGDLSGRIISTVLKKYLPQPVVVKNVPGGGSLVGAKELVDSKADGYTLGFLGISAVIGQYMSVAPVMLNQYDPVSGILNPSPILFVNQDAPWKTFSEFVEYGKKNPMKLKHGHSGTGANQHLQSEEFMIATGVKFTQIPFKGYGPALTELAGGHVDVAFTPMGAAKSLVSAGKIRPLAIAADKRHPSYPDIPTMKEGGHNVVLLFWESIVVPKGTPKEIVSVLDDAIKKAFADPDFLRMTKDAALDLEYIGTEAIAKLRTDSDRTYSKIIKDLGLEMKK